MAKFAYSSLFDNGTLSSVVDNDIDRLAQSGRISPIFTDAVKAKYGIEVPTTKAKFLAFRAEHVKFASLPAEERAKLDDKPVLWVSGHLLRSRLYGAMDAITAGLTNCERMPDAADWLSLFAPAPKPKAPTVPKVQAPALAPPVATFPALGAAPKSSPAGAAAGAASDSTAGALSWVEMVDQIEALIDSDLLPGDMVKRLELAVLRQQKRQQRKPVNVEAPALVEALF